MKKEIKYSGYFLLDTGLKIEVEISEEDGGENFAEMATNSDFPYEKGDTIWLGEGNDMLLLVDRIAGFYFTEWVV